MPVYMLNIKCSAYLKNLSGRTESNMIGRRVEVQLMAHLLTMAKSQFHSSDENNNIY